VPLPRDSWIIDGHAVVPSYDTAVSVHAAAPAGSGIIPQQKDRRTDRILLPTDLFAAGFEPTAQRFDAVRGESDRAGLPGRRKQAPPHSLDPITETALPLRHFGSNFDRFRHCRPAELEMGAFRNGQKGEEGLSGSTASIRGGLIILGIVFACEFAGISAVWQEGAP